MSGKISGYVSCDGGAVAGVGGFITEDSFGMNHLNGFAADFSGNVCGFYFTTVSGILPVCYNVVTQQNVSGRLYIASGTNVVVPPATISGVFASVPIATISGTNAVVPIATISGAIANSGLFVVATASVASGSLYLASGSIFLETFAGSGVLGASGGLALSWGNSGQVKTVSGTTWIASGPFVNANIVASLGTAVTNSDFTIASATATTVTLPTTYTDTTSLPDDDRYVDTVLQVITGTGQGQFVVLSTAAAGARTYDVVAGTMPVQLDNTSQCIVLGSTRADVTATVASGSLYLASGSIFRATFASGALGASGGLPLSWGNSGQVLTVSGTTWIASGPFVQATATVASGSIYLASGSIFLETFAGSGVLGASGGLALSWGNSGQVKTVSGTMWIASGPNVVVPPATISGVFGTIPIATISGTNVFVPSGTLQIASGAFAAASVVSGSLYLASGSIFKNTYASGVMSIEFPYAFLKVDQSGITGEAQRSPLNAMRKLTNAWDTTALSGFLTIYKENDSSTAFTQSITAVLAASGAPITGLDTQ